MDVFLALVVISLAAAPLALLSGWLAGRGSRPLGAIVNGRDTEGWWRSTMPWPQGVQEEDDVTWTFRANPQPRETDRPDEIRIEPTHLRPHVRRR